MHLGIEANRYTQDGLPNEAAFPEALETVIVFKSFLDEEEEKQTSK